MNGPLKERFAKLSPEQQAYSREYIRKHPKFNITDAVLCKCCGEQIAGWIDDDRFDETRVIGGKPMLMRRMLFARYNSYKEIEIEMKDGGKHVTQLCRACLKGMDESKLNAIYVADLVQFARGGPVTTSLIEREARGYREL
jgi:hypothetical protein